MRARGSPAGTADAQGDEAGAMAVGEVGEMAGLYRVRREGAHEERPAYFFMDPSRNIEPRHFPG